MAFARAFVLLALASLLAHTSNAQLSPSFYAGRCPNLQSIVRSVMSQAVAREPRMGASILRLFFHDCFVNVHIFLYLYIYLFSLFFPSFAPQL
jgi:peroxidase